MAIRALDTGLLYADAFDRADGAPGSGYTILQGGWSIASGALKNTPGADHDRLEVTGGGTATEMVVQGRVARSGTAMSAELLAKWNHGADTGYLWQMMDTQVRLFRRSPGAWNLINSVSTAGNGTGYHTLKLEARPGFQKGWLDSNESLAVEATDTTLDASAGHGALRGGSAGEKTWDDVLVCKGNWIEVRGVPAGGKIAVGALEAAADANGVARVGLGGTALPVGTVQVLDSGGFVVESYSNAYGGAILEVYTPVVGGGTLTRDSTGLLAARQAAHAERPFAAGDWTLGAGLAAAVDATTGRLQLTPSGSWHAALFGAIASRGKMLVQTVSRRASADSTSAAGPVAHMGAPASGQGATPGVLGYHSVGAATETSRLAEWSGSAETVLSESVPGARAAGTDIRHTVFADGTAAEHYDNTEQIGGAGTATRTAGQAGVMVKGSVAEEFAAFFAMTDRFLTVNGLADGWKIRAAGVTSAAAAGGTAQVDTLWAHFPITSLEVLNNAGGIEGKWAQEAWGGDVFTFAPAATDKLVSRLEGGLLFRDRFDDRTGALGSNYTVRSGSTWSIAGGILQVNAPAAGDRVEITALEELTTAVVQYAFRRQEAVGIASAARMTEDGQNAFLFDSEGDDDHALKARKNGSDTYLSQSRHAEPFGTWRTSKALFRGDLEQKGWIDGALAASAASNALNGVSGRVGLRATSAGTQILELDDLVVCRANWIEMQNLPLNWRFEVDGVLSGRSEGPNYNPTVMDPGGLAFPATTIRVLDDHDILQTELSPEGGVYGGDIWWYGPLMVPTITVLEERGPVRLQVVKPAEDTTVYDGSEWEFYLPYKGPNVFGYQTGAIEGGWDILEIDADLLARGWENEARVRLKSGTEWGPWSTRADVFPWWATPAAADTEPMGTKAEWEADQATAILTNASTKRRPDSLSSDYLAAHSYGPKALADPSAGVLDRAWRTRYDAETGEVFLARASVSRLEQAGGAPAGWDAETLLFTPGLGLLETDLAFDQNGRPVFVAERPNATTAESEVWIRWHKPVEAAYVWEKLLDGRCPRILLDDPKTSSESDLLLFYVNDAADRIEYRVQRDLYVEAKTTPIVRVARYYLEELAHLGNHRLQLIGSVRDEKTLTWAIAKLDSAPYPLRLDPERFTPGKDPQTATTPVVVLQAAHQTAERFTPGKDPLDAAMILLVTYIQNQTPEAFTPGKDPLDATLPSVVITADDQTAEAFQTGKDPLDAAMTTVVITAAHQEVETFQTAKTLLGASMPAA